MMPSDPHRQATAAMREHLLALLNAAVPRMQSVMAMPGWRRTLSASASPMTAGAKLLTAAIQQLHLCVNETQRLLRLARTIADLAESELIMAHQIIEAVQYRASTGRKR